MRSRTLLGEGDDVTIKKQHKWSVLEVVVFEPEIRDRRAFDLHN